jgi:hypothetical protein
MATRCRGAGHLTRIGVLVCRCVGKEAKVGHASEIKIKLETYMGCGMM